MESWMKPVGIGELLDRSFQLYRKYFLKAFMIVLLFIGPIYLIQNLLFFDYSEVTDFNFSLTWDAAFTGAELNPGNEVTSGWQILFSLVVLPLYLIFVFPIALSANLHLVRAASQGEQPSIGELLKRSLSPFWKNSGYSVLYGLILIGIYFALVLAVLLTVFILMFVLSIIGMGMLQWTASSQALDILMVVVLLLLYVALVAAIVTCFLFFVIRLGFYLPVLALNKESGPFGKSWRLTKHSFWRIYATLIVLTAIYGVFSLGIYLLIFYLFEASLVGQLVSVLLSLLILPLYTITYGVVFHDLLFRSRGSDLEVRIDTAIGEYQKQWESGYSNGTPSVGGPMNPAPATGYPPGSAGSTYRNAPEDQ